MIVQGKDLSTLQQGIATLRGNFVITKTTLNDLLPKSPCMKYNAALRLGRFIHVSAAFRVRNAPVWKMVDRLARCTPHCKWKFISKKEFLPKAAGNKTNTYVALITSDEKKSEDRHCTTRPTTLNLQFVCVLCLALHF